MVRPVAGDLADPRRRVVLWLFLGLGERGSRARRRTARRPGHPAQRGCAAACASSSSTSCRPGCSSPCRCSCRSRSGCRRSRPASGCCRCRSRCCSRPRGSRASSRLSLAGWCSRFPGAVGRHVVLIAGLDARRRRSWPGRCCSSASASARSPRSSGPSPSRRSPTTERRGRRPAEHGHEPRRLPRHGPGGGDPDRGADHVVPDGHRAEPRISSVSSRPGPDRQRYAVVSDADARRPQGGRRTASREERHAAGELEVRLMLDRPERPGSGRCRRAASR